ncbi:MAG TPA: GH32 C-terminal domain-containing protein, partial [Aeromicrobium sp.]|nr:GH32 C-terminal domain-containing protein [Aeromicrobium sp.]
DRAVRQSAYNELYRPQLQFTPAKNWMNDPNGLVYHDGEYHLFYQYNPNGNSWGDMSWGHAVSRDLVHWKELPIALEVEKDANGGVTQMFFSGSAVVDKKNTSGFGKPGKPAMVAVFTSVYPQTMTLANGKTVQAGTQAQSLAYSTDRGRTWTQYAGNPVIAEPPPPYADQFRDFRDPKVFWYEPGKKWVMVAALSTLRKAVLYSSTDLKNWTFMSEFGPVNATGGAWECPDLFELPVDEKRGEHDRGERKDATRKWVLIVNLNPGGPAGGSGAQYFVGGFDGSRFTVDPGTTFDAEAPPDSTLFEDFEGDNFAQMGWTATGEFVTQNWPNSWGSGDNRHGTKAADTFLGDDSAAGTLSSREFTITRKHINLLVGGGRHPHVDGTNDGSSPPAGAPLFDGAGLEGPAGVTYDSLGWTPGGDLVGQPVSAGRIGGQMAVTKFNGSGLINTFVNGDATQGRLASPPFVIGKPYLNFLVGGGNHPYEAGSPTAVVLKVGGQVVRSATGRNTESLNWTSWDVSAWQGQSAQIEVIDANTGSWGHVLADDFRAADAPERPLSDETAINLVVDGRVVASATGENSGLLSWRHWNVAAYAGRTARLEIVDRNTTNDWGHFFVDYINFSDQPKEVAHWVDQGADFYAAVSWNGVPDGRRLAIGWMSNWDYAGSIPTSPWRSAQTLVRELGLKTVDGQTRLVQKPVEAFSKLRQAPAYQTGARRVAPGVTPLPLKRRAVPLEIEAVFKPDAAGKVGLKVLTGANGDETIVGYDAAAGEVYIDRSKSGDVSFSSTFAARHAAPLGLRDGAVKLHIIVDTASVTVFAGDGDVVLTDQVFPDPSSNGVALFAEGGRAEVKKLTVWPLKSIWADR